MTNLPNKLKYPIRSTVPSAPILFAQGTVLTLLTIAFLAVKFGYWYFPRPTASYLSLAAVFMIFTSLRWKISPAQVLLTSAPTIILIYWAVFEKNLISTAPVKFFPIIFIVALICFWLGKIYRSLPDKKSFSANSPVSHRLAVFFLTALFFVFGAVDLGKQSLVDESYWVFERVEKYWDNILEGDWRNTRINDKPGITVAIFSGAALFKYDQTKVLKKAPLSPTEREKLLYSFRLPLLIAVSLFLPFFYFLSRRLLGDDGALLSYIFIASSPLLLGISRTVNPDALLWLFLPLALLSFLIFLFENGSARRFALLGGGFFGLALLTKYVTNILLVFLPLATFLYLILFDDSKNEELRQKLRRFLSGYAVFVLTGLIVFIFLFPGTWVKPDRILLGTIWSQAFGSPIWQLFLFAAVVLWYDVFYRKESLMARIVLSLRRYRNALNASVIFGTLFIVLFLLFDVWASHLVPYTEILQSPKSSPDKHFFPAVLAADYYTLFFGITPLALAGLLWLPLAFRRKLCSQHFCATVVAILAFVFIYYLGALFGGIAATVRYQIALYPLILLPAGGIIALILSRYRAETRNIFVFLIALSSFTTVLVNAPYHFSYASALLPPQYALNPKDMGDGSYQAAMYLNSLPEAENLRVWSDKNGVCAFFAGRCNNNRQTLRDFLRGREIDLDYLVLSAGRQSRTAGIVGSGLSEVIKQMYEIPTTEAWQTIYPGNRPSNFVKIVPAQKILDHLFPNGLNLGHPNQSEIPQKPK